MVLIYLKVKISVKNPIKYLSMITLLSYVQAILGKQYRRFKINSINNNNNKRKINLKNRNLFYPILLVVNTRYTNTNSLIKRF